VKILFSSHFFAPSVGGIEEAGELLAREFASVGHEVIVTTQTGSEPAEPLPFEVRRRPGAAELARLARWSDVVFHNNVSLRAAWPLAGIRRPWVVAHHTWIARADGRIAAVDQLKRCIVRHASRNIAVSTALARSLGRDVRVIPNPYRDIVFRRLNGTPEGDLIFAGRLVSDKGADLLLDALALLKTRGAAPHATIVGDGPERAALEAQAARLGLAVRFAGIRRGEALAALLNHHRVLVVPSRWEEPFGIIALEGMACGCVPLVANSGGLPETVGAAGAVFAKGDARALADAIERLLGDAGHCEQLRRAAPPHLDRHRAAIIARRYLDVIEEAVS
jgi:glycosyltransferase involved in cell wall biosynthesis